MLTVFLSLPSRAHAATPQTLTFPPMADHLTTDAPFPVEATASSGLPVTWGIVSAGNVASISGGIVTLTGTPGTVTLKASQEGDGAYSAAPPVFRTFVVQAVATRFVQVAAGTAGYHSAGIRVDGTLWTWGRNSSGQLGDNSLTDRPSQVQVGTAATWAAVAAGASHTVALQSNGTLWAWGGNSFGQLGDGTTTTRKVPVQIGTGTWAAVACGENHTVALRTDGTLWTWGYNRNGQLGSGSLTSRSAPAQVGTATWSRITCGTSHTLGIASDGTLWAWGWNSAGQLGDNTSVDRSAPVKIGTATTWTTVAGGQAHTLALRADGTLWAWGWNANGELGNGTTSLTPRLTPAQLGALTTWTSVAAANGRSFATRADGSLWAWGNNAGGRLGDGSTTSRTLPVQVGADMAAWPAIACAYTHTTALTATGTLWSWGGNNYGQLGCGSATVPQTTPAQVGSSFWRKVASRNHTAAIRSDGTLWTWGADDEGQLGNDTVSTTPAPAPAQLGNATDWTAVAVGSSHTVALRADGSLWAWGVNFAGQVGDGTTTRRLVPVQIGAGSTWTAIACGSAHTLARRADGTLWAWGSNYEGQLGDGTTINRTSPVQIGTATTWSTTLVCGEGHSLALQTDGTLWAWGSNAIYQLGDGTTTRRTTPVQVGSATDWAALAAGDSHSLALRADGSLWGWGSNISGALGLGSQSSQSTPLRLGTARWRSIACGSNFSLGVRANGILWAVGDNFYAQLGDGSTSDRTRWVPAGTAMTWGSVEGGGTHGMALRQDGSLWAWGGNPDGRLGFLDTSLPMRTAPRAAAQFIVFPALPAPGAAGQPVPLAATVPSGLPITYTVTGPGTLAGSAVNPTGLGTVTVAAYQPGDASWQPASPVERTFYLGPRISVTGQGLPLLPTPGMENGSDFGSRNTLGGTAPSAPPHTRTFTVANTGNYDLTLLSITSGGSHPGDFSVSQPASSLIPPGGTTTFQVTFTPLAAGLRQAVISVASDEPETGLLTFAVQGTGIAVPVQVLDFPTPAARSITDAPFPLAAWSSGGLPVCYTLVGGSGVASVSSDGIVTLTGTPGAVTVRASQAGDGVLSPAADIYRTFMVTDPAQRFVQLASSSGSSLAAAIRADGTLWICGLSQNGQLVDGFVQVGAGATWTAVDCGAQHIVALREDGTLWAQGYNADGRLGDGTTTDRNTLVQVGTGTAWAAIACGSSHTLALQTDGSLWAWGRNVEGQLGDGTTTNRSSPVQIGNAATWTAIACGPSHNLALRSGGTLWAWGLNNEGQLGDGTLTTRTVPIQVGAGTTWTAAAGGRTHTLALDVTGTVWAWGSNAAGELGTDTPVRSTLPARVDGLPEITSIVCGASHSLAMQGGSTLWAWGGNSYGQLGDGTMLSRKAPAAFGPLASWKTVTAGSSHTLALRGDGTLWRWGGTQFGEGPFNRADRGRVGTATDWKSAAAGSVHTLGLRTDGSLWSWGGNSYGQLGTGSAGAVAYQPALVPPGGSPGTPWSAVSAGSFHTLAMRADGSAWVWGLNMNGELGYPSLGNGGQDAYATPMPASASPVAEVRGGYLNSMFLMADGSLIGYGKNEDGQFGYGGGDYVEIGHGQTWSEMAAGERHALFLRPDGTLWSCGNDTFGQLGNDPPYPGFMPAQVGTSADWTAIAAGGFHSAGLRADGSLWVWGSIRNDAFPGNPPASVTTPAQVSPGTTWTAIACGRAHIAAIRADGTLWAWGVNDAGQLGDGTTTTRLAPVQVGAATSWVSLACGHAHTVAIRSDGTLWTWGDNSGNQLGIRDPSRPLPAWPPRAEQTLALPVLSGLTIGQPVALGATASSGLPVTYTVAGPATLSGNVLTATGPGLVTLTAYQAGDDVWQIADSAMQAVQATAPTTAQQSWRQTHFGTTANSGDAADTADADHDGLPNLLEFAFGLTPTAGSSASAQLPQPVHNPVAQTFTYTFTEPAEVAGTGLIYSASASTSLASGSWVNVPDTGSGATHIFTVPTSGQTQVFLQLHVTAP